MLPGNDGGQRAVNDLGTFQKGLRQLVADAPQPFSSVHRGMLKIAGRRFKRIRGLRAWLDPESLTPHAHPHS